MCFNNRIYPHNHHLKEELEHFHYPESSRGKFCGKLLICVAEHLPLAVCTSSISRSLALVSHLEGQGLEPPGRPPWAVSSQVVHCPLCWQDGSSFSAGQPAMGRWGVLGKAAPETGRGQMAGAGSF